MTLLIPYEYTGISIDTNINRDLELNFGNSAELRNNLFNQLVYGMSYDDIIRAITPQSFENIIEYYKTEYEE